MFCPNCGKQTNDNEDKCSHCNYEIKEKTSISTIIKITILIIIASTAVFWMLTNQEKVVEFHNKVISLFSNNETYTEISEENNKNTTNTAKRNTPTSMKNETDYAQSGTTYEFGDLDITINGASSFKKIEDGYGFFNADEGNTYFCIDITLYNRGEKAIEFLKTFKMTDDITVKIIYKETYEYTPFNMIGYSKSLNGEYVQPLETKSGIVVFSLPDSVIDNFNNIQLIFECQTEKIIYRYEK